MAGIHLLVLIYVAIATTAALPIRSVPEEQANVTIAEKDALTEVINGVLAFNSLAKSGLPEHIHNPSEFYPACNVIDYAEKLAQQPSASYQGSEQADELEVVSRHIKADTCSWISSATDGLLNDDEGICSESALKLFCTKVKIHKETYVSFDELRRKDSSIVFGQSSRCMWVNGIEASENALNYMRTQMQCI